MLKNRKLQLWAICLLIVGLMGYQRGEHTADTMPWALSLKQGENEAALLHRPLLIYFWSADCSWCEKMEAETFSDPHVLQLSKRFVCVRIDGEVNSAVCARYRVMAFPVTILATADGSPRLRMEGYVPPGQFAQTLKAMTAKQP